MMHTAPIGIAMLLALTLGCTDHATAPQPSTENLTVSGGVQPMISWTPGEPVYSVTVTRVAGGAILWAALGELHDNRISPTVGYGTTPVGAISTANVVNPLVAGTLYRVKLERRDPNGSLQTVGAITFRP